MSCIEPRKQLVVGEAVLLNGPDVPPASPSGCGHARRRGCSVLVGPDAVAERGQAIVDLGPEGDRDRTDTSPSTDPSAPNARLNLAAGPSALDEAGLQALALLAEADKRHGVAVR